MDPRRILSRLSPRVLPLGGGNSGGTEPITGLDVAAALAGLPVITSLLLRVKWGGQEQYRPDLEEAALELAWEVFARHGWRYRSTLTVERLVVTALDHVICPMLCKACRGRVASDDGLAMVVCQGMGWRWPARPAVGPGKGIMGVGRWRRPSASRRRSGSRSGPNAARP